MSTTDLAAQTLVVQSHRQPFPTPWLQTCCASVQAWATAHGYAYRFLDDALFALLPLDIRARCGAQLPIAADVARLYALQQALDEGYGAVVWCDADVLVVDAPRLTLPPGPYAFGREVWVREHQGRPRAYRHVHNAMMLFRQGNPFLGFYRHAAERIVRRHAPGEMAPQIVGPKLLTTLHHLVQGDVIEAANMLSPCVMRDLRAGGGPYLDLFEQRCTVPPAALNLCASLVGPQLCDADLATVLQTYPPSP